MSSNIFFVIQRAGRWQIFSGDDARPLAVQDNEAAAEQWCRSRAGGDAVVYHGQWFPRPGQRRSA